jgi:hypothetical protein
MAVAGPPPNGQPADRYDGPAAPEAQETVVRGHLSAAGDNGLSVGELGKLLPTWGQVRISNTLRRMKRNGTLEQRGERRGARYFPVADDG